MKNVRKFKRLFTFGCSFTQYHWPTWADILGNDANYFENWALAGGGNDFILNRLVECNQRNRLTKDDLVMIMWSGVTREDHYNELWQLRGNIYTCHDAGDILKNRSPQGYLLKSLNYIAAAKSILDSIGCEYHFLSMLPIGALEFDAQQPNSEMLDLYQDVLSSVKPSVFEVVYDCDWSSTEPKVWLNFNGRQGYDPHPAPSLHLEYLMKTFPDLRLSKSTKVFVESWTQRVVNLTREEHDKIIDPIGRGRLFPLPKIKAF